ncbi:helix-turn-helix transcriptional regulator [Fredinandcohnia sp. QZ13]|uniref:helix-turn-helix domain-containing protein n=1 Tax=Fredinandcohnia sp. QZ13 TaxID=3073144 RepID=UPI002852FB8B|nr:helix-turn-helix transcriptional regulator [Fredinandcohnia sp. QZ13]MDR4890075.1 helix-turn-helix transcriptional regulator [Fredinandcohnia sp. QZ13]
MLEKVIGHNVKRIRTKKKVFQEDLALDIGISPTYLNRIENGKATPSIPLIERISTELDVSSNELMINGDIIKSDKNVELKLTLAEIYEGIPEKYHEEIIKFNMSLANIISIKESETK